MQININKILKKEFIIIVKTTQNSQIRIIRKKYKRFRNTYKIPFNFIDFIKYKKSELIYSFYKIKVADNFE